MGREGDLAKQKAKQMMQRKKQAAAAAAKEKEDARTRERRALAAEQAQQAAAAAEQSDEQARHRQFLAGKAHVALRGEAATATDTEADGGALPEGFFDAGVDPSQDVATEENDTPANSPAQQADSAALEGEALPTGFFDDKKEDAAAHGVDLDAALNSEFAKFQTEIKVEEARHQLLAEVDAEERHADQEEDGENEQSALVSRLDRLKQLRAQRGMKRKFEAGVVAAPTPADDVDEDGGAAPSSVVAALKAGYFRRAQQDMGGGESDEESTDADGFDARASFLDWRCTNIGK